MLTASWSVVESADPQKTELALDFECSSGNGFWLAAKATGSDGSLAHTTPVYVVREPLRFWEIEAVEPLIAQRMVRSPAGRRPMPSPTAPPAKATTKSGSN